MQLPGMPRWISSASQRGSSAILMQGGSPQGTACPRRLSARHGAPINKRPSQHAAEGQRQLGTGSLRRPRVGGGSCSGAGRWAILVTAALGHSNNSVPAPQPGDPNSTGSQVSRRAISK